MKYYFKEKIAPDTNVFPKIRIAQLKEIPIISIIKNCKEYLEIVKLVEQLLQLNKDIQTATLETQKEQIQNRIAYCEDKINAIVYELYGLNEEEIKIIEG